MNETGDVQREDVTATEPRVPLWWHFWCSGCDAEKVRRFDCKDAEYEAAVRWMEDHPPGAEHHRGGFITPVQPPSSLPEQVSHIGRQLQTEEGS